MKLALAFIGGMLVASLGHLWYVQDTTAEILAFLESHEAVVGKTFFIPLK